MFLLKYFCPDCGTIFYAEERQGNMSCCPYCQSTKVYKTGEELEAEG